MTTATKLIQLACDLRAIAILAALLCGCAGEPYVESIAPGHALAVWPGGHVEDAEPVIVPMVDPFAGAPDLRAVPLGEAHHAHR